MAAQGAIVATATDDAAVQSLLRTTRWQEAWIPLNPARPHDNKRHRHCAHSGIYVASVYAKARTDNTQLFRQVWAAAARVGDAPNS